MVSRTPRRLNAEPFDLPAFQHEVATDPKWVTVEGEDDVPTKIPHPSSGAELLQAAIAEPTIDRFLDGNPKVLMPTLEAYRPLVAILRRDRAANIAAEVKKRGGGVVTTKENEDEEG